MPIAILLQIVNRTFLWIFLISLDSVGTLAFLLNPQKGWAYVTWLVLAIITFASTWLFKQDALIRDIREICLYDVFVQSVALILFLLAIRTSTIHITLGAAIGFFKYGRLVWPSKTSAGDSFSSWPIFGVIGWWYRRTNKSLAATDCGFTRQQANSVYLFFAIGLLAGLIVALTKFELKLAYFCIFPLLATPYLYKHTRVEILAQHARYLSAEQAKVEAQTAAAQSAAKAEADHAIAEEKEKSNQLLAAKNEELAAKNEELAAKNTELDTLNESLAIKNAELQTKNTELAQAHAEITDLLVERDKSKAEVEHLNRALLHAAHDMAQPLLLLRFAAIRLVEAEDEEARALAKQELDQLHLNLADECNAAIYGAKVATKLAVPQVKAFSINEMLRELWFSWRDEAEQQGIDAFLMWPPGNPPLHVAGDPMLIGRVVRNLILNAIMYAGKGSNILFSVRKRKTHALVQVWNSGAGIPGYDSRDGEANFAAFAQQMLEEGQRRGDGHGLGIDNVKHLSIALGLRMTMQSRVGVGTVFGFRIPLAEYRLMAYT